MMKITGLSHLFKWENLHNWWLTKYFFAPLYIIFYIDYFKQCAKLYNCVIIKRILCVCVYIYIYIS